MITNTKPLTVYRSSAGSGKTFTLVAEYIAMLLKANSPNEYRHILAVTFTVKATGEMKDRILGTLYNIAVIHDKNQSACERSKDINSYLKKIAEIIKNDSMASFTEEEIDGYSQHAKKILLEILHNYDQFKVTTIDSFFQSVLNGVAHELGLPANIRTEINDDEVRKMAVERLISSLTPDKDEKSDKLKKRILDFVGDRVDEGAQWSITDLLQTFSKQLGKEVYRQNSRRLQKELEDAPKLIEDMRVKLFAIKNTCEHNVKPITGKVLKFIDDNSLTDNKSFDGRELGWILSGIVNAEQFKAIGKTIPAYATGIKPPEKMLKRDCLNDNVAINLATALCSIIQDFYDEYSEILIRYNSAKLVQKNIHQLGLLSSIDNEVNEINTENQQLLLSQTGTLLNDLMNGEGNTEFVFEKIGPMLNHLMMDEFQDTSWQQWNNFRPLLRELLGNNRQNLIVGDVKQSIYRWRNGDWHILENMGKRDEFANQISAKNLIYNFRSDNIIVAFNNYVFPRLASLMDDVSDFGDNQIADAYSEVCQLLPAEKSDKAPQGHVYVKIYKSEADFENNHYDDLRRQVLYLHQEKNIPYSKMTVLVRNNKTSGKIIDAFSEGETQSIKLVSADAFQFKSSTAVQMIIAALRYMNDLDDFVSKSYLAFHYQKDILHKTMKDDDIFAKITKSDELLPEILINNVDSLRKLPLYELNERLVKGMKLDEIPNQSEYILAFLDKVMTYSHKYAADTVSFLDYWDKTLSSDAITTTDKNALQIMTIHKSKGLAFDYVFMPECDTEMCRFRLDSIYWIPTAGKGEPYQDISVLPIDFGSTSMVSDSIFADELKEETRQTMMDAINLLYVGCTRAKKGLFIWGYDKKSDLTTSSPISQALNSVLSSSCEPIDKDNKSLTYIFDNQNRPPEYDSILSSEKPQTIQGRDAAESRMEPKFEDDNAEENLKKTIHCSIGDRMFTPVFRQSMDSREFGCSKDDNGNYMRMNLGSLYHKILCNIMTSEDLDSAIRRCRQEEELTEEQEKHFRHLFETGIRSDVVMDWFSDKYVVYNEQNILSKESDKLAVHRPDRVMISKDGKQIVVVDFKFTAFESVKANKSQWRSYQRQVYGYMRLMHQMFPDKAITGYLWFLDDNQIQNVKGVNNE